MALSDLHALHSNIASIKHAILFSSCAIDCETDLVMDQLPPKPKKVPRRPKPQESLATPLPPKFK